VRKVQKVLFKFSNCSCWRHLQQAGNSPVAHTAICESYFYELLASFQCYDEIFCNSVPPSAANCAKHRRKVSFAFAFHCWNVLKCAEMLKTAEMCCDLAMHGFCMFQFALRHIRHENVYCYRQFFEVWPCSPKLLSDYPMVVKQGFSVCWWWQ